MSCYLRHMKDVLAEAGIEITKENKRKVDGAIHSLVDVAYKQCSPTWKAVKAEINEDDRAKGAVCQKAQAEARIGVRWRETGREFKPVSDVVRKVFMRGFIVGIVGCILLAGVSLVSGENRRAEVATFAGGSFWYMEVAYDALDGVMMTTVGYTGGEEKDPTYEEVSSGRTGHAEAIQVVFDPSKITYADLLDVFWRNIDPTQINAQFTDKGPQYRTAIFYHSDEQKRIAEASKEALERSGRFHTRIVTDVVPATGFYRAEEYHQEYYKKNPLRYEVYRRGSGRDQFIKSVWGGEN